MITSPRSAALADAVATVDHIVGLLRTHGPDSCGTALQTIADIGREGLTGAADPVDAAIEMRRRWGHLGRPFSDVVIHSDEHDERTRLNSELESLKIQFDRAVTSVIINRDIGEESRDHLTGETTGYEVGTFTSTSGARRPVIRSTEAEVVDFWVGFDDAGRQVDLFGGRHAESCVLRISGDRRRRQVVDSAVDVAVHRVERISAAFRTRWSVTDATGTEIFRLVEGIGDALWRRLVRPFPRAFSGGAPDVFGAILLSPLLLLARVRPYCHMSVADSAGGIVGRITFASDVRSAREHLLVTSEVSSIDVLVAALAAVSVMR
ncbi:hypothetical protein [Williamsia deligens]|uniref:PE-PGRS family protein n=1 Tax=Williamsia deligens TaxID=321325 RepID=A0ABW3GCJ1_9NOCA|nr:hypothetical protein [Williamsia deligens]MCP2192721.1 hypothetical protein [Williamsia deligens]